MKNYTLINEGYLLDIKETGKYYIHNKTGAKVITIKSNDPNKVFCIAFNTLPPSSNGVCHILEHSVLCGSKKYNVKDPFAILSKTSLNTYLNAFTTPHMTFYPVASLNKKDFNNLMDVYLDAVFNPLIYDKKEIFLEEGWRYEYDKENNKLKVNGVVFNEMIGYVSSVDYFVGKKIEEELFSNTPYFYECGGKPFDIPSLSYEEFLDYHKKYYQASNAYIFLYGDLDIEERLEYLDKEYLSKYEKVEYPKVEFPIKNYVPHKLDIDYEPYNDNLDSCVFTYNIAFNHNISQLKNFTIGLILDDLEAESSRLQKRLVDENICENFEIYFEGSNYERYVSFVAKGAKKEKEELFYKIIDEEFSYIVKNGIDKEKYKSFITILDFKIRENYYSSSPRGIAYSNMILQTLIYDEADVFKTFNYLDLEKELLEKMDTGYIESVIDECFIKNNHKVKITFNPRVGVKKEEEIKFNQFLDKKLKSFSKEDLDNLEKESIKLLEYINSPDSKESLSKMPKLTLKDIDINPIKYNIKKINNYMYHSNYDTNGIVYKKFLFNLKKFKNEELQYIKLFCSLCMLVDTTDFTYEELDLLESKFSGGIETKISLYEKDKVYNPYFVIQTSYLIDNSKKCMDIIESFLLRSKFDSKKRIKQLINELYDNMKEKINRKGTTYALRRALSYTVESEAFNELIFGITYFNFISRIKNNFDKEYEKLEEYLRTLPSRIFVKDTMICNFTGTDKEYEVDLKTTNHFYELLNDTNSTNNKFIFNPKIKNEAFIINSNVNYVACGGEYQSDFKSKYFLLGNYVTMEYLWNMVRVKGGAYGVSLDIDDCYISFTSYRDPNIKSTLEAFKSTSDYVKNLNLDKETLDHLKLTTIGSNNDSLHNKLLADRGFKKMLLNTSYEETLKTRKEIVKSTLSDLQECHNILEETLNLNSYCVIGNEEEIYKNKELFKTITKLF